MQPAGNAGSAVSAGVDALDFDSLIASDRWQEPGDYYRTLEVELRATAEAIVGGDVVLRADLRALLPDMKRDGAIIDWRRADQRLIELTQRKQLYAGKVVAADGTHVPVETVSLVGAQIGVISIGYQGTTGRMVTNILQSGITVPVNPTMDEIKAAIRSRVELRSALPERYITAIRNFKEREILLGAGPEVFKIGHGSLFPYEMLIGGGRFHILPQCLGLIGRLIDDGRYAMIVSRTTDMRLRYLGMALEAGEYLIVDTGTAVLEDFLYGETGDDNNPAAHFIRQVSAKYSHKYGGRSQFDFFKDFMVAYGPKVVRGVLRAHPMAPPYMFFCNADRVDQAVHTLMADAANTGARGFPLLVDLADQTCSGMFKASEFKARVAAELVRASGSGIYGDERDTRDYATA
jgi:hypothetical protein